MKHFLLIVITLLFGCSENKIKENNNSSMQGMAELDLSQYGMNLLVQIPDSSAGTLDVIAQSYGDIEIRVGSFFQIKIAPGGDLTLKKSDLESDLLFKTTIIREEPGLIVYKSDLPDGSKSYYHFYAVLTIGGASYEVSDINDSAEPYSEETINKMVKAAMTVQSSQTKS